MPNGGAGEVRRASFLFMGLGAVPLAALLATFLLPYAAAVREGVSGIFPALGDEGIRRILIFTVKQAALSTLAALLLGLPGAWLLGSGRFRGAPLVRAVVSIPFAMPPILVVLGFVLFFGNGGWANRLLMAAGGFPEPPLRLLYRTEAIVVAHAFYNFPIVLRLVGDAVAAAKATYGPAASSLGASGPVAFLTVLLPIALPSVAAASLLVFLYCFTSFAVVLILGGGPGATTLPVEIYRAARISLDYRTAGSLALIETLLAALAFLSYARMERLSRSLSGIAEDTVREQKEAAADSAVKGSAAGAAAAILYLILVAVIVVGPVLAVAAESFLSRTTRGSAAEFSLRWWLSIRNSALPALGRSLLLAATAATLSSLLATAASLAAWGRQAFRPDGSTARPPLIERAAAALFMAPLASSGIVLGLGWIKFYGSNLARSFWAVALAHAVSALPFAYRSISEGFRTIPFRTAGASATLGASPIVTALRIALPGAGRRIRSAWAFAAAVSLGELNAVLMLGLEGYETLPLLVYRAAGAYRFGAACAAGVLLAIACASAFILSEGE